MSFPHVTREICEIALRERGSNKLAAQALGMPYTTFRKRLAGRLPKEAERKFEASTIIDEIVACGSLKAAAAFLGIDRHTARDVLKRADLYRTIQAKQAVHLEIENGVVLIGSDIHIWPDLVTTGMAAFHLFASTLAPVAIILNGDVIDGASISRHPPTPGRKPTIVDEIDATADYLDELFRAAPQAHHIWTMGNHDDRFERKLREATGDKYVGIEGTELKDHFPEWKPCWTVWINEGAGRSPVLILHAFRGGQSATFNNTLYSGVHTVTGHLHNLHATPFNDTWGIRWGIDSGMLAAVPDRFGHGPQFTHYVRGRPVNWRAGFVVLTFKDSKLLMPELVHVKDEDEGLVEFRGEVIKV